MLHSLDMCSNFLDMRMTFANGGWIGVDGIGLPGPLYLRVRRDDADRLEISEFYLDGSRSENEITQRGLRAIPFSLIEARINASAPNDYPRPEPPGPDLSVLASYFRTSSPNFSLDERAPSNWVMLSLAAQDPNVGPQIVKQAPVVPATARAVKHSPREWVVVEDDDAFVMTQGPTDGLTDAFLHEVKRAYDAAVRRGDRPIKAIAEQIDVPRKSVERWVSKARDRGIMPRGKQGQAG